MPKVKAVTSFDIVVDFSTRIENASSSFVYSFISTSTAAAITNTTEITAKITMTPLFESRRLLD
jgi:hypothetical protein